MKKFLLIALLFTVPVQAQTAYLIMVDKITALSVSQQKCIQMGCDGKNTIYWWNVIQNPTTGVWAIEVDISPRQEGDFTSSTMTTIQKNALIPKISMDPTWFPVSTLSTLTQGN